MVDLNLPLDQRLAAHLLDIGAVTFSPEAPYTWASGLRAPIYCDNRLTLGYPPIRRAIARGFADYIASAGLSPDVIVGTATAGIAHAAWVADQMDLPMAYVRSKPKAHGRGNQIEGPTHPGQQAVVIEDLISTGMSSVAVADVLREAGVTPAMVLAIFAYGLPQATAAFEERALPLYTLTSFETLLAVAERRALLSAAQVASLNAWHEDPQGWSAAVSGA